jgi:DNA-directed RNA polymerase subunit RPC12/RpoP
MEYVSVVASGYEFICPKCQHYNTLIELDEILICESCKEKYLLGEVVTEID